jgi:hypothetical protein
MRADRAIVVSLRKSGTHLISGVLATLGLRPYGHVAQRGGARPLGREQAWRVLQQVYLPEELAALRASDQSDLVTQAVEQGVDVFFDTWWTRLGVRERPEMATPPPDLVARVSGQPLRFADTPAGLCWFTHQLDLDRADPAFLRVWAATGEPRILLMYRDPRDVLLSMVEFLSGDPTTTGAFADHRVYAGIMRGVDTITEQLTIALTDPHFPGADAYDRALWLLRHPAVCPVSFEELVGPDGGGTGEAQLAAVQRIADFLGACTDPATLAKHAFDRGAHTFRHGRIGRWREHFTAEHAELFEQRFGRTAHAFGYR